jgi:hypothetical protein
MKASYRPFNLGRMSLTSATVSATTYRSITVTMIVAFAVTFGFLYWKQKSRHAPALPATPVIVRQVDRAASPPPERSVEPAVAPAPAPPAAAPAPAQKSAVATLPVLFTVTQRTGSTDEEDSPGEPVTGEAHLINSSDKDLAVAVIALNLSTQETSQAQVYLGANAEGHVGPSEGLKIRSGDRITLRSPGFPDLELTVP